MNRRTPEPPNGVVVLRRLVDEIERGRIRLYRNLVGKPYISCDVEEDEDDDEPGLPAINQLLFDIDVRSWLTLFAWERDKVLLTEREANRIVHALSGWSMRVKTSKITDPELLRFIETEPVVAVVMEFMGSRKEPRYEQGMEHLWKELSKFAKGRGLLVVNKSRFPGGPNVLSRKLRQLVPVLEKLGIKVAMTRSNGCKAVLRRLDDFSKEPSAESSAQKSYQANDLSPEDGKSSILSILQSKLSRDRPTETT
ncbi:hypothetical protein [Paludisphaera sp.]|uniref:hypothetical protein n=1 Tax=Paludisphaera sp. TaxID=2017432 RepID=UPI00301DD6C8